MIFSDKEPFLEQASSGAAMKKFKLFMSIS